MQGLKYISLIICSILILFSCSKQSQFSVGGVEIEDTEWDAWDATFWGQRNIVANYNNVTCLSFYKSKDNVIGYAVSSPFNEILLYKLSSSGNKVIGIDFETDRNYGKDFIYINGNDSLDVNNIDTIVGNIHVILKRDKEKLKIQLNKIK